MKNLTFEKVALLGLAMAKVCTKTTLSDDINPEQSEFFK